MNTFGRNFRISIFGESHGERIGVVIDGCPPGISIEEHDLLLILKEEKAVLKEQLTEKKATFPCSEAVFSMGKRQEHLF